MTRVTSTLTLLMLLYGCAQPATHFTPSSNPDNFDNSIDIALYKKAVRENPSNPYYLVSLAEKYVETSQWSMAAASFHEALLLAPTAERAILGKSYAHLALGDYETAFNLAQNGFGKELSLKAELITAIALDGLEKREQSNLIYTRLIEQNPRNLAARTNLALSLAFANDPYAYDVMRKVAYSPDAQLRHKHNLILVSALLGKIKRARLDGESFQISKDTVDQIIEVAGRARLHGVEVVGVANATDL